MSEDMRQRVAETLWNDEQLIPWSRAFQNPDFRYDMEVLFERVDTLLATVLPDGGDMHVRCTCGETACESELCDCDAIPCPVNHRAEEAEAQVARLQGELITALNRVTALEKNGAELLAHRDALINEVKTLQQDLDEFGEAQKTWLRFRRERDVLKAAVEKLSARHQPKTVPSVKSCGQHPPRGVCTSCETGEVTVCSNLTCCEWPCADRLAIDAATEWPVEPTYDERKIAALRPWANWAMAASGSPTYPADAALDTPSAPESPGSKS